MSVASDELKSRAPAERHVECYLRVKKWKREFYAW